jgi:hypothetical protein
MELNLIQMLAIGREPDFSSSNASYYIHVPQLAPYGYLHIIFAPTDRQVLVHSAQYLLIPECLQSFFSTQNGANLFFGRLSIFGILERGRLLNRGADRVQAPFDIEKENSRWNFLPEEEWLLIAAYSYDGTQVTLHRSGGNVRAVERKSHKPLSEWPSLDVYLRNEIKRLTPLFDTAGNLLVDPKYTVPGSESIA